MWKIGMMIVASSLLAGCNTAATDQMDAFFNSLSRPRPAPPDPYEYKNRPGYAPAYPAFDRDQPDMFFDRDLTPEPTPLYR